MTNASKTRSMVPPTEVQNTALRSKCKRAAPASQGLGSIRLLLTRLAVNCHIATKAITPISRHKSEGGFMPLLYLGIERRRRNDAADAGRIELQKHRQQCLDIRNGAACLNEDKVGNRNCHCRHLGRYSKV